nr:EOG090X04UV [Lepidurus arcticus]
MADTVATDGGKLVKMEVDYSSTCDEKIPMCLKLGSEGKVNEALDILLSLEKQTRTGTDAISTGRVLVAIVQLLYNAQQWETLLEQIVALTKRRSQLKAAVTKMVQECCMYVDKLPSKELQFRLIDTLRNVTAGKIYVEVERARLSRRLAEIKEAEGDINEAANIMQELQVETFGSMEKREKVEFILEQMRLCLAKKDFIRTQIMSKKISIKFFDEKDSHDLKLKFYKLMIEMDQSERSYLSICKHYRAIYNTDVIQADDTEKRRVLQHAILYLLLAPFDNEQSDLTHRLVQEKLLEEMPIYKELLQQFIASEIILWSWLCERFEADLRGGAHGLPAPEVFLPNTEDGEKRWKDMKSRVVEHNIRIMAKYYTRVTLERMAQLLDLTVQDTETFLSNLVTSKTVVAKTDRLDGIVHFGSAANSGQDANVLLNNWSRGLSELMDLVTKANHLINREEMVHRHLLSNAAATAQD